MTTLTRDEIAEYYARDRRLHYGVDRAFLSEWLAENWPKNQEAWSLSEAVSAGLDIEHAAFIAIEKGGRFRATVVMLVADVSARDRFRLRDRFVTLLQWAENK